MIFVECLFFYLKFYLYKDDSIYIYTVDNIFWYIFYGKCLNNFVNHYKHIG